MAIIVEVNGQTLEAEAGEILIKVTDRAGIYIPRFCYHEQLSIAANCRMCLVEVEKASNPLPACSTPVMEGMKVFTKSKLAKEAQKGTMEFLLINHPLDCPICDQGGECPLQDQAVSYGKNNSRFMEKKRVVPSYNIGPLVATEMTRCIHCTRCIRFGKEVAGVMEMGALGRGEFMKIGTFLNQSVDSEVSGNMIDLCPVGALTSKLYRFSARSWELQNHPSISPHDCIGTNINIQTLRNRVERILPIDNPAINECWLADRDRYSYEAVNSNHRLTHPMIRDYQESEQSGWREVEWQTALKYATEGIKTVLHSNSADQIGGLASATSTLEEFYLFQKLLKSINSENVDHRLQQCDFKDDAVAPHFPGSELPITDYSSVTSVLLVGSNIRKEQPLLSLRLREATIKNNAKVSALNTLSYEMNFPMAENVAVEPNRFIAQLAGLAAEVSRIKGISLPVSIQAHICESSLMKISASHICKGGKDGLIIIGAIAQQHENASASKAISQWICETIGCKMAILPPANSAAGWVANCLPGDSGLNTIEMLQKGLRAYLLLNAEPELDCIDGQTALSAMKQADFIVQISAFKSELVMEYASVLLPMTAFTESAGSYVNCEGKVQHAQAAVPPMGNAQPAWKILRILGNFLDAPGFDYIHLNDVTAEIDLADLQPSARITPWQMPPHIEYHNAAGLQRLMDIPMYRVDSTVRRAAALQNTVDNPTPAVHINRHLREKLSFQMDKMVVARNSCGSAKLPLQVDDRVPNNCVYIPAGYIETASLGGHKSITLEKA